MEADLSRRILILRREFLFQGLDPAQLSRVASIFEEARFPSGGVIFSQDDAPDFFYIVLEGKVRVMRREGSGERQLNILGPGDYFGEQELLFNNPRSASIYAETDVLLLSLEQDTFQTLLAEYPQIHENMAATAQSRNLVRNLRFPWKDKEEVFYYITRKHPVFLLISMLWPVLVALICAVVWLLLGALMDLLIFLAIPLAISAAWFGWVYLDWSNDYYIVTNQRVVWQEKVVMLYDSRQEAALNTVVSVNTTTSLIGRMLDYGNVEVRTFTGVIPMKRMSRPYLFASFVEGYRKRVQALSKEQEEHEIENALHTALLKSTSSPEVETPAGEVLKPGVPAPFKAPLPRRQETFLDELRKALQTFLKVRYQEGRVITYRKHYLLLLKGAIIPFLLTLAVLFGLGWAIIAKQYLFALVLVLLFLGVFAWLIYEYMDWSNDIYRLTPEQIMDIEKKPLGREQKTTSNLDAPDFRIEHIRKNIINIIFNYGNVIVNVGETKFTFDGVYNPDQVHQDVANYRFALQRKKQEDQNKRDRDRMINWLVAYHKQADTLEKPENPSNN